MRQLTANVLVAVLTVATVAGCGTQASPLAAGTQGQLQASKLTAEQIKVERVRALVGSWSLAYVNQHYKGTTPDAELKGVTVRAVAAGGYNFTSKIFYKDTTTMGNVQVKGHYDAKNRKYSQVTFKEIDIDHRAR